MTRGYVRQTLNSHQVFQRHDSVNNCLESLVIVLCVHLSAHQTIGQQFLFCRFHFFYTHTLMFFGLMTPQTCMRITPFTIKTLYANLFVTLIAPSHIISRS